MREGFENLAVMFTDIVGYTETTASMSRTESAELLSKHNEILSPIPARFRGEIVKSIGDALLVIFASPTDALLCAMAMQDAMHAYNEGLDLQQQIHIRIAVNVGEVRVVEGDVLGDPVNVASRIEHITPPDQIYFSEAVHMTMNRAEVAAQAVGLRDLKGVAEPVKIFTIPPFCGTKLVPTDELSSAGNRYPFGGWHLREIYNDQPNNRSTPFVLGTVAAVVLLCLFLGFTKWSYFTAKTTTVVPVSAFSGQSAERKPVLSGNSDGSIRRAPLPPFPPKIMKNLRESFEQIPPEQRFPMLKQMHRRMEEQRVERPGK